MRKITFLLKISTLLLIFSPVMAQQNIAESVRQAMDSEIRTDEEKARDANRQPAEVLTFFRLDQNMSVIELIPAGGWYTKILAPVLKENGKLYITQPENFYSEATDTMLSLPDLSDVERLQWGSGDNGGAGLPAPGDWIIRDIDMVLTFRNYHNFSPEGRLAVNRSAFESLRPGGYYGVIDHTRRHMEQDSRTNGRRVDPVIAIKEIQEAGFILVDYSTLLARPEDKLNLEVSDPSVTGKTDRFTLLFQKPE